MLLAVLNFFSTLAAAQIAVSVGVQEIYEDNVFLEDDIGAFTPEALEGIQQLPEEDQELFELPESQNGDPDDAFLTNLTLGISGGSPFSKYANLSFDATAGLIFFSGVDDQDRWSLDSLIELRPAEYVLPQWLDISANSAFQTDSFDSGIAEGSLARQTTRHIATLNVGTSHQLSKTVISALTYRLQQTSFIGETTFSDSEDEEDLSQLLDDDDDGADFLSHTFGISLSKQFAARTTGSIGTSLQLIEFSGGSSPDDEDFNDEIDRQLWSAEAGLVHSFSEKFSVNGRVGFSRTSFDEAREGRDVFALDVEEGLEVIATEGSDDTPTTLTFSAGLNYIPNSAIAFGAFANQSVGLNSEGAEVAVRTINLNLTYIASDRLAFTAGGQHFETANDEDFEVDGLERLSSTLSATYSLSPSLTVSAGWSFTDQSGTLSQDGLDGLLFRSEDYESNRFFLSINKGLVGLPL